MKNIVDNNSLATRSWVTPSNTHHRDACLQYAYAWASAHTPTLLISIAAMGLSTPDVTCTSRVSYASDTAHHMFL
jgi:hypothetical protein